MTRPQTKSRVILVNLGSLWTTSHSDWWVWQRWPKSRLNQTAPSNSQRHFFTVPRLVSGRERREVLN